MDRLTDMHRVAVKVYLLCHNTQKFITYLVVDNNTQMPFLFLVNHKFINLHPTKIHLPHYPN